MHDADRGAWPMYGGRGITVFDEWVGAGGFAKFIEHVGRRPTSRHSIDRIDNSNGYHPGNVRWATKQQQARNTRGNKIIAAFGEELCLAEWAERIGFSRETIAKRLAGGWPSERALHEPLRGWGGLVG